MQPYLFPYIGYFQLISAVDLFVVYDNIKYTKKDGLQNRILQGGKNTLFLASSKRRFGFLEVKDRELATDFSEKTSQSAKGGLPILAIL